MSRTTKLLIGAGSVAAICLLLGAAPGHTCKRCQKQGKLLPSRQVEQAVEILEHAREILTLAHRTCEDPEQTAMVAEILLLAAAKESDGKIDGRAELEAALQHIKDPGTRTFTHFLAAVSSAMVEDTEGVTAHLQAVIAESQEER